MHTANKGDGNRLEQFSPKGVGELEHLAVVIPAVQERGDAEEHGVGHAQKRHNPGKHTRPIVSAV